MVVKTPGTAGQRPTTEGSTDRSPQPVCANYRHLSPVSSDRAASLIVGSICGPIDSKKQVGDIIATSIRNSTSLVVLSPRTPWHPQNGRSYALNQLTPIFVRLDDLRGNVHRLRRRSARQCRHMKRLVVRCSDGGEIDRSRARLSVSNRLQPQNGLFAAAARVSTPSGNPELASPRLKPTPAFVRSVSRDACRVNRPFPARSLSYNACLRDHSLQLEEGGLWSQRLRRVYFSLDLCSAPSPAFSRNPFH